MQIKSWVSWGFKSYFWDQWVLKIDKYECCQCFFSFLLIWIINNYILFWQPLKAEAETMSSWAKVVYLREKCGKQKRVGRVTYGKAIKCALVSQLPLRTTGVQIMVGALWERVWNMPQNYLPEGLGGLTFASGDVNFLLTSLLFTGAKCLLWLRELIEMLIMYN